MAWSSFADLADAAKSTGSLAQAVIQRESEETGTPTAELRMRMREALRVMRAAVKRGLDGDAHSLSGQVGGDAARLAARSSGIFAEALAAALAAAEVNASMGRVVAAPTGGASGVVPAVLLTFAEHYAKSEDDLVDALFTAGGVGSIIAARGTLSGASGGCQAEIGSATAMAAAAGTEMLGGDATRCGHAAALALQGLLGLVCDPVGGLVEVPCVVRNATGTAVALAAIEMALAGISFPIPLDEVIDAQASVGSALPLNLRETARGGLAVTPSACRIVATGPGSAGSTANDDSRGAR